MDVVRGEWKEDISYEMVFKYKDVPGWAGYRFACDKDGNVVPGLNEAAEKNLAYCKSHPEEFSVYGEVKKIVNRYREPDTGTCRCGQKVELYDQYMGACECPSCGQWYNMAGQELLPPDKWGWDGTPVDEDY